MLALEGLGPGVGLVITGVADYGFFGQAEKLLAARR